jgi:hypothetical protein
MTIKAISKYITPARLAALSLGTACAGLNAVAAYAASGIAGAIIGLSAVSLPALADHAAREGKRVKSAALWLAAIPCLVISLGNIAERTHSVRAVGEAERAAVTQAADRGRADLTAAKTKLTAVEADERKARADKKCKPDCLARWSAATANARTRVIEAEHTLQSIEAKAVTEATLKAPTWLAGVAIDGIAFASLWLGLAPIPAPIPVAPKVPAKRQRSKSAQLINLSWEKKRRQARAANEN